MFLFENTTDIWTRLQGEERDILLYGMGNGADKLLEVTDARGIRISGIFASDGFVRGHAFHGMRVQSFSEICAAYPPNGAVILLAFGSSRPEVLALMEQVAARYPLYVPDLPVCGTHLFDAAFVSAHRTEIEQARALLSDAPSKRLFDDIIGGKLSPDLASLLAAVSERDALSYLKEHKLPITRMADLGAYNGDSAREVLAHFPLSYLLAAEPDRRNFAKLSAWSEGVADVEIECHRVAIFDRVGEGAFDASGNRNAGLCTGRESVSVPTASLDALLNGRAIDYIKYDIEGAEREGLLGARETIARHRPALRVALYHRPEDIFALPLLVAELAENYDFYLTRERSLPLWDIDLIALPR